MKNATIGLERAPALLNSPSAQGICRYRGYQRFAARLPHLPLPVPTGGHALTVSEIPVAAREDTRPHRVMTMAPRSWFKARAEQLLLGVIIVVPLVGIAAAIPLLWNRWVSWRDVILLVVLYAITGHGITVGFH